MSGLTAEELEPEEDEEQLPRWKIPLDMTNTPKYINRDENPSTENKASQTMCENMQESPLF